jgi:hypothetical protein
MGPAPRIRPVPPARPGHAGGLPLWERLAFAALIAFMVAFVVAITISAAHAHTHAADDWSRPGGTGPRGTGLHGTRLRNTGGPGGRRQPVQAGGLRRRLNGRALPAAWDQRLARALAPILGHRTGSLAVGVIDTTTGNEAVYGGRLHFHTASIVKVDILATLLLQHQRSGAPLSDAEQDLAAQMIEVSNDDAASDLWDTVGEAAGLATADKTLGLTSTVSVRTTFWGLTSTTVGDQLRLLADLTTAGSPLDVSSRAYELGLMRDVVPDQRWGVSVAASPGTSYAIKNGWLPDRVLWVTNSIGVLDHQGQRLLLAVLSDHQPTEATGIFQVQAAARAAAACITRS